MSKTILSRIQNYAIMVIGLALYAFGVTFMAIIAYALHSPDMGYQIGKAIIVNVLIWLLMLQHYYGLLMPKAPD